MPHNVATVPTKRTARVKSPNGRPLSNESLIGFSFMDALISADDAIAKKRAAIKADIDEYNAMVRHRRNLKALSTVLAA